MMILTKAFWLLLVTLVVLLFGTAAACVEVLRIYYRVEQLADPVAQSSLTAQFRMVQATPSPQGGPQALEGYTRVAHDRGDVYLGIGTIGNVEMNARGNVHELRSMQAGGVVTNDGHVDHWAGVSISMPRAGEGYQGPVHIDSYSYIDFDNGWSIRPAGNDLLICSPSNVCKRF